MWDCGRSTQINQWSSTESPEIDQHRQSRLIFDKGTKAIKWGKVFSTSSTGTTGHPYAKITNLDTDLMLFSKINSKQITDPTIKLLRDNTEKNPGVSGNSDEFLDTTSKA